MAEYQYMVRIDTDIELSDWELDELRQVVVDFLTADEGTEVEVQ